MSEKLSDDDRLELIALFNALADEAMEAASRLEKDKSEFSRRVYVKTVITVVEGITQWLKRATLLYHRISTDSVLSDEEAVILREERIYLKENGTVGKRVLNTPLLPNFRFAAETYAKVRETELDLGVGTAGWEALDMAVRIRDRITHPRKLSDLDVSPEELERIEDGMAYFRERTAPLLMLLE